MAEAVAADPAVLEVFLQPYSLSPDASREPDFGPQSDQALQRAAGIDPSLSGWVTVFVMAPHNTKIVRRSNGLLGWVYGKNFRYREVMSTGKSFVAPLVAAGLAGGFAVGTRFGARVAPLITVGVVRKVLDLILPRPGSGPGKALRELGWFRMQTFAHTTSGATYLVTFAAKGDPGYAATSIMLGESGLALAFDELSDVTGVVTPAAAMGDQLIARLRAAAMDIAAMDITVQRGADAQVSGYSDTG